MIPEWLNIENTLHVTIALFSTIVLFYIQVNFLQTRPIVGEPDNPASFFRLDQIASHRRLKSISYLFSIPFALLFLFTDLEARAFVEATKQLLGTYITSLLHDQNIKHDAEAALKQLPEFLNPLFILAVSLLLFAPYIRAPLLFLRDLVLKATGLEARANRVALKSAEGVLSRFKFNKAEERLASAFSGAVPLPEKLVRANERLKLAYQVLYLSRDAISQIGLEAAVDATLEEIGVAPSAKGNRPPDLKFWHLAAAATFYLVLCGLYVLFVPLPAEWIQKDPLIQVFFQPIEWPVPGQGQVSLLISIAQRTLSFVMPLAIGMYLYATRANMCPNADTRIQRFGMVFAVQFLQAFIVNLVFATYFVSQRYLENLSNAQISLGDVKIWEDVFAPSLAPGAALLAWLFCSRLRFKWLAYVVSCLVVGSWFYLAQYLYEFLAVHTCASQDCAWRGYYWHQFLLGAFLMFSYFIAALAASDVLLPPAEPKEFRVTEPDGLAVPAQ